VEHGVVGLEDRSRAPHRHPNATSGWVHEEIVRLRKKHGWGGRKIVDWLGRHHAESELPARSTVDAILKRHGLVQPRQRRRARSEVSYAKTVTGPNDRWCGDFKGWFRTGDGSRCEPFTLTDSHSRFLLRCSSCSSTKTATVKKHFERAFGEYGLPDSIRTDNGSPFASTGIGGLSRLSVWWIRLGIYPDFIEPGKPQQNGRHERMHRTLKAETATPPKPSVRAQDSAFRSFVHHYNHERPHEGIGGKVPGDLYDASGRLYPSRLPEPSYPDEFLVRRVSEVGSIKLEGERYFLGRALAGQDIALEPGPGSTLEVHFGLFIIGVIDQASKKVLPYRKPIPAT